MLYRGEEGSAGVRIRGVGRGAWVVRGWMRGWGVRGAEGRDLGTRRHSTVSRIGTAGLATAKQTGCERHGRKMKMRRRSDWVSCIT